jgi:predicted nucleic acid-binding protein
MAPEPDPVTVVADADVLAADLLVGGAARAALDAVRAHDWLTLVVSDPLLDDAAAVVRALADAELATDWRERVADLGEFVDHPAGDHPALACAHRGRAAHLLSFDEELRRARTGAALKPHVETSVKHPDAFARLFDPAAVYEAVVGDEYPGPDRDPRA